MRRGSVRRTSRWGNTCDPCRDLLFARASDIVADLGPEFVRLRRVRSPGSCRVRSPKTSAPAATIRSTTTSRSWPTRRVLDRDVGAFGSKISGAILTCSVSWRTSASRLEWCSS